MSAASAEKSIAAWSKLPSFAVDKSIIIIAFHKHLSFHCNSLLIVKHLPQLLQKSCLSYSVVVVPSPLPQRRLQPWRLRLKWSRTCTTGIALMNHYMSLYHGTDTLCIALSRRAPRSASHQPTAKPILTRASLSASTAACPNSSKST